MKNLCLYQAALQNDTTYLKNRDASIFLSCFLVTSFEKRNLDRFYFMLRKELRNNFFFSHFKSGERIPVKPVDVIDIILPQHESFCVLKGSFISFED